MTEAAEKLITRVLIVEDDSDIADSLASYLRNRGNEVECAENGREGLRLVRESQFQVVITDVMMPEMNGIDFLEKAKADYPDLDVILVTGYADIKLAIEAMKKGASDFFTKPFQYDQIENSVRRLTEKTATALATGNLPNKQFDSLSQKLEKKVQELSVLYSISEAMESVEDADHLFDSLVELACSITHSMGAAFYLNDGIDRRFFLKSKFDHYLDERRSQEAVFSPRVIDSLAHSKKSLSYFDADGLEIYRPFSLTNERVHSLLLAPLYVRTERFGVLTIEDKKDGTPYDESEINLINLLLKKASIALENSALYETIYNNLVNTLRSLVTTLEAKDQYTQLHSDRVTKLSVKIARTLGCSEEDIEIISFAGLLHDIGKIGVSDAVLQKQGKLTDDEYEIIKEHPRIGAQILEPLCMMPREQEIILHHHERWDGRGYPDGLAGKDIPFLARIVSLADAYDAMTSDRVYRKGLPHEIAVEEIRRNAGLQFDKMIVRAFLTMCEKRIQKSGLIV